jgi:hypothetical protein
MKNSLRPAFCIDSIDQQQIFNFSPRYLWPNKCPQGNNSIIQYETQIYTPVIDLIPVFNFANGVVVNGG